MSKNKKIGLKVFGATIGIAAAGGIVGFAATNWDGIQKIAQGPVYSEKELAEQVKDSQAQGNESGYQKGYEEGYTEGQNDGYSAGKEEGYHEGHEEGYTKGQNDGYVSGKEEGFEDGKNYVPEYANLSELDLSGTFYKYDVGNNRKFISTSENEGIYLINNEMQTFSKIFENGKQWDYFQTLENGDCLIGSSINEGVLYFNNELNSVELLPDFNNRIKGFKLLNNGDVILFEFGNDVYKFSFTNKSIEKLIESTIESYGTLSYYSVVGDYIFCSGSSASVKLWCYNLVNNSLTKVYDDYFNVSETIILNNVNILLLNKNNSSSKNFLVYDVQEETIIDFEYSGISYSYYFVLDNGNVILSSSSTGKNVLYLDITTNTITTLDLTGSVKCYSIDNTKTLVINNKNIYLFENNEFSLIYTASANYSKFIELGNDYVLLKVYNNSTNFLLFNKIDCSIKLTSLSGNYDSIFSFESEIFCCSTSNSPGVYKFNPETQEFVNILTTGYGYEFSIKDNEVICENENYVYKYDNNTQKMVLVSIK